MRIACLQFASRVGDTDYNIQHAEVILEQAEQAGDLKDLDLIVLPELAFTGYNFKSLHQISPSLEPTEAGVSTAWARGVAKAYNCLVAVGYPETVDITEKWPADPEYYSSAVMVKPSGRVVLHYRKTHLYPTDEKWALESADGFYARSIGGLGKVAFGIGMDIKFEAPWTAWEFANDIIDEGDTNLVIVPMSWPVSLDHDPRADPSDPDLEILSIWLSRLEPLIRGEREGEIIVVFANRCGLEDTAAYAGTSAVLGIEGGEVKVYGILGRGENELLVADTSQEPKAKLVNNESSPLQYNLPTPRVSDFPRPKSSNQEFGTSIDAMLSTKITVSPVEPRFPHTYYTDQPLRAEELLKSLPSSARHETSHSGSTSVRSSTGSSIQHPKPDPPPPHNDRQDPGSASAEDGVGHRMREEEDEQKGEYHNSRRSALYKEASKSTVRSLEELAHLELESNESATASNFEDNTSGTSEASLRTHTPWVGSNTLREVSSNRIPPLPAWDEHTAHRNHQKPALRLNAAIAPVVASRNEAMMQDDAIPISPIERRRASRRKERLKSHYEGFSPIVTGAYPQDDDFPASPSSMTAQPPWAEPRVSRGQQDRMDGFGPASDLGVPSVLRNLANMGSQSHLGISGSQSSLGLSRAEGGLAESAAHSSLGISSAKPTFSIPGPQSTLDVSTAASSVGVYSAQSSLSVSTAKTSLDISPAKSNLAIPSNLADRTPTPATRKTPPKTPGRSSRSSRRNQQFEEAVPLTPPLKNRSVPPTPPSLLKDRALLPSPPSIIDGGSEARLSNMIVLDEADHSKRGETSSATPTGREKATKERKKANRVTPQAFSSLGVDLGESSEDRPRSTMF